jgi:S1-C subfamily serine protease
VRYTDSQFDLCGLDVSGLPATPVAIGSVKSISVGQRVYAIGAPRGLELSISEGLVSSLRPISGSLNIQTTAAMSPGSSGGGLFDHNGFLVGITTFVVKDGQNLNFALPADLIHGLPARSADMNMPPRVASPSVPQLSPQRTETTNRKVLLGDMGNVVEKESVKNGFRSQASFSAYNGYIIINPVDLDKYHMGKSMEVVQNFISRIGRTIYDQGLVDEDYKLFVQIHGVEYVTNVHKCRLGQLNILEKSHK